MVHQSMSTHLLICGVDKSLLIINAALSCVLFMASHYTWPHGLVGPAFFMLCHLLACQLCRHDPLYGQLLLRQLRMQWQPYYPAKGAPHRVIHWRGMAVMDVTL